MGGDDLGVVKTGQEFDQGSAGARVQVGGGLVHDQDVGRHRQHRGNGDRPFFAAGQLIGRPVAEMFHPDPSKGGKHALLHLFGREAKVERTKGDVLKHRWHEQLVVRVLENHPNRAADVPEGGLGEGKIADAHCAALRRERAVEMEQQGRFAGPVGPDHGHRLAVMDAKGDAAHRGGAVGISVAQILDFNDVMAHGTRLMGQVR